MKTDKNRQAVQKIGAMEEYGKVTSVIADIRSADRKKRKTHKGGKESQVVRSSVILLAENEQATRNCIKYLRKYSPSDTEIVVAIGADNIDLVDGFRQIKGIRLAYDENRRRVTNVFALGASIAKGENLVFMHSHVMVSKHWLDHIIACARLVGDRCIIAPCSNCGIGDQLCTAAIGHVLDEIEHVAYRLGIERRNVRFRAEMISGDCFLIKRRTYFEPGNVAGFLEAAQSIDEFLAVARDEGFDLVVAGDAYVHNLDVNKDYVSSPLRENQRRGNPCTVSLCMIVKNEEHNLERCLESVKDYVDEMVIVDTGSKDRTVEIAERFGARVFHFEWCNDFSAARNYALDRATCDWILSMDADEALELRMETSLRDVISLPRARATAIALRVKILTEKNGEPFESEVGLRRLFPNNPRIRFTGKIHEQVGHLDGQDKLDLVSAEDVVLRHYGYLPGEYEAKNKDQRNLEIIVSSLKENPDDPYQWFNLGQQHYTAGRYEDSLECFDKSISLGRKSGLALAYMPVAYSSYICSLVEIGKIDEAVRAGIEGASRFEYTGIYFNLGTAYVRLRDYEKALSQYARAIGCVEPSKSYLIDPSFSTWRPREAMAIIYSVLGDYEKAFQLINEALSFVPDRPLLLSRAAQIAEMVGRLEDAEVWLQKALDLENDSQFFRLELVRVLMVQGKEKKARELMESFPETGHVPFEMGGASSVLINRGLIWLGLGDHASADKDFAQALLLCGNDTRALNYLASTFTTVGNHILAREVYQKLLEIEPGNCEVLLAIARLDTVNGKPANAIEFLEQAIRLPDDCREAEDLLVECYLLVGNLQAAYDLLVGKLENAPDDVTTRCKLANLLLEVEESEAALDLLGQGLSLDDKDPRLYERLGATLTRLDRFEDAKNAYSLALSLDPDCIGIREAIEATDILLAFQNQGEAQRVR